MTTSLMSRDKAEAKKKGLIAAVGWSATAALMIGGFPVVMTVAAAGGSGYLTYKWFMYRAKRGMRF